MYVNGRLECMRMEEWEAEAGSQGMHGPVPSSPHHRIPIQLHEWAVAVSRYILAVSGMVRVRI